MNNTTIAILLSDIILIKIFEEISKNYEDQLEFKIISNEDDISDYNVIITDTINLNKYNQDNFSKNQKVLCIGEKNNFDNGIDINSEVSYLKVPFKFSDLKERAENLFSLITLEKNKVKEFKYFNYENQNRLIQREDKSLRLTEKENEIFNLLISKTNEYISREKLLSEIWNYNKEIDTHTLETHMYSLRKKIENKLKLKDLIIYKEKKGYVINSVFL